jgi:hypothetical protein
MSGWVKKAGLQILAHDILPPPWRDGRTGLTVSIWQLAPLGATAAADKHQIETIRADG